MNKLFMFLKTNLLCLALFLSLFGFSQSAQAQSWVQENTQGGFILKKVLSDTAVATGQPFSYTIYYTIPAGATNVTIIDNLSPLGIFLGASWNNACGVPTVVQPTVNQMGGTFSLSWASVPNSCTGSFTITVAFPNGTTCPGSVIRNNVCLQGTLDNKLYEFCTGYVNATAIAVNPWHINKYPIGVAWQGGTCPYASASDTITYQICVYKDVGTTGQLNLVNGIVKDTLPAGAVLVSSTCGATQTGNVITWNVGNLSANQMYNTVCCQFKVYYPSNIFQPGSPLLNQATLSGALGGQQQPCSNFSAQSNQTCVQVSQVTKGTLYKWVYTNRQPGCAGQYVIYVCNNGTTNLPVTVLDTLPTALINYSIGAQWNLTGSISSGIVTVTGTLTPGQCGYVYINFTIPANATIGSTITNCAWLVQATGGMQSACVSFVVDAPAPTPCLWKEVCNKQPNYTPGSIFRYRLRIQNIGGMPLTNVTLTDQLDPNLEYVGNPSYYIDNNWNTPCTTTPANPWTGVIGLSYNSGTNVITATIDTVPAVCQNIFYSNCGMYGTAGVPFYFIEFDVKVRDSSALGNVPNNFKLSGGSLGTVSYTSNTDYVLIVGVVGFSLDKGVKKPTDPNYGTSVSTTTGSTVNYRLKMNSSGTAQLRYVTFADLLPKDAPADSKILQLCGPRGTTGTFDISYNSFMSSAPAISQWKNTFSGTLANVNNFWPTGAPGNAFTNGCGSSGSWLTSWVANDKNLGAHFGPVAIGVTGATVEFAANVVPGPAPATGILCNTFAASGWTKHLTQSNIVSFQLAGQSESSPVCVAIDTTPTQTHCIDSVKISVKCIGKDPATGLYNYSIQITATSCTPATILLNSPDGNFSPSSFSLSSSPWTINPTFTHTNANNPIKIRFAVMCAGVICRDSLMLDLPPCDHQEPGQCCDTFIHKVEQPHIAWTSTGVVNLGVPMIAGPAPIKKFSATIVSAQLRRLGGPWQRIFGDIVGGSLVVAPAPGPQLLSIYSREAVWGEGQCIDWMSGANLILKMVFPPVGGFWWNDTLMFAIRYSFTDCNCLTCDTVIYYKIFRKWKHIPWDDTGFGIIRGSSNGDKSDKVQGDAPASTGVVMDDANNGTLWVISPDNPDNDVTITGVEVNSLQVPLTEIKNGTSDGFIEGSVGFVESNIVKGNKTPVSLKFNNSGSVMQFTVYVRFAYKIQGFDETLYSEALPYKARVPGAKSDEMNIDKDTKPDKVASYALFISNANGYNEGIASISIKPVGSQKLLAVGPPFSDNGRTFLVPQVLEDGSYVISIPSQGISGLDASKTAKPIFITLSGVDESNSDIDFITFDNNNQMISQGTLKLTNPISAVSDGSDGLNSGSVLNPVSPNPAKNFVTVSFSVNESGNAKLSIIDLSGKEVLRVLDNQNLEQGNYIRGVDISNLPSGAYFIVLRTQNGVSTKSLSIVR